MKNDANTESQRRTTEFSDEKKELTVTDMFPTQKLPISAGCVSDLFYTKENHIRDVRVFEQFPTQLFAELVHPVPRCNRKHADGVLHSALFAGDVVRDAAVGAVALSDALTREETLHRGNSCAKGLRTLCVILWGYV